MYKISLSVKERHKHSKDVDESDLLKTIFKTQGWSFPCIAQALRIDETSVTRFISDYCNSSQ